MPIEQPTSIQIATTPLYAAVHTVFDQMDSIELKWHLRDLLAMATRSDRWQQMTAKESEEFFNATEILIDNLDALSIAFDGIDATPT